MTDKTTEIPDRFVISRILPRLVKIDAAAASRLEKAATSWERGGRELTELHPDSLINVSQLHEQVYLQSPKRWLLVIIDVFRNALLLVPIIYTWYELSEAARRYNLLLQTDDGVASQSFLALWERRFQNSGGLTFGEVAATAALLLGGVLAAVVILAFIKAGVERWIEREAGQLIAQVDQALWELQWAAAQERTRDRINQNQTSRQLREAVSSFEIAQTQGTEALGNALTTFKEQVNEMLDFLSAERRLLKEATSRRREELNLLKYFGENLVNGTDALVAYGQSVEATSTDMQRVIERLTQQVEHTNEHYASLVRGLTAVEAQVKESTKAARTANLGLREAANELRVASAQQVGDLKVINLAVAELRELTSSLLAGETALRDTLVHVTEQLEEQFSFITEMAATSTKLTTDITISHTALMTRMDEVVTELGNLHATNVVIGEEVGRLVSTYKHQFGNLLDTLIATSEGHKEVLQEVIIHSHKLTDLATATSTTHVDYSVTLATLEATLKEITDRLTETPLGTELLIETLNQAAQELTTIQTTLSSHLPALLATVSTRLTEPHADGDGHEGGRG